MAPQAGGVDTGGASGLRVLVVEDAEDGLGAEEGESDGAALEAFEGLDAEGQVEAGEGAGAPDEQGGDPGDGPEAEAVGKARAGASVGHEVIEVIDQPAQTLGGRGPLGRGEQRLGERQARPPVRGGQPDPWPDLIRDFDA